VLVSSLLFFDFRSACIWVRNRRASHALDALIAIPAGYANVARQFNRTHQNARAQPYLLPPSRDPIYSPPPPPTLPRASAFSSAATSAAPGRPSAAAGLGRTRGRSMRSRTGRRQKGRPCQAQPWRIPRSSARSSLPETEDLLHGVRVRRPSGELFSAAPS
jgi:hypothetical protein